MKKKLINVWVGAIPVSGEIQEWLQSLVVRLNWLNEFSQQMTFSSPECRWTTSLNKKGCLPFATLVIISCLTHRCFHSHWYFIVLLWDTRLTILTSKELRYNLLTFTIFIIQSQGGAIPVFSRLSKHVWAPYWTYCQLVPSAFVQHIKTSHAYLSRNS